MHDLSARVRPPGHPGIPDPLLKDPAAAAGCTAGVCGALSAPRGGRGYTPEWRRQEELAKAERKARAKSRPAPSAPEAGPPPAQPANTAPATPGQKEAGGETAPHKERDQILRQEYDYGLLDPELDRVSSQSPDTEAPYGAFDLIETSPDEVGGP